MPGPTSDVKITASEAHAVLGGMIAKGLDAIHPQVGWVLAEDLDPEDRPSPGDLLTMTLTCQEWKLIQFAIEMSREQIRPKGGS